MFGSHLPSCASANGNVAILGKRLAESMIPFHISQILCLVFSHKNIHMNVLLLPHSPVQTLYITLDSYEDPKKTQLTI